MLVLGRKKGEAVMIGNDIELRVLEVVGDTVKIGIRAPREVDILRKELYESVETMNQHAGEGTISMQDLMKQFGKIKNK
jgi:carbon storage regulator